MTKQEKSDENVTSSKKGENFLRNFILITFTLLFISGIFLFSQERLGLIENFYPVATSSTDANYNKEAIPDNELVKDALEASYSTGPEPPFLSFAPEETSEDTKSAAEKMEAVNPYIKIIEKENNSSETTKSIMLNHNLNEYRLYLANANKLISKFKADKSYGLELDILKKRQLPAHAEKLVVLLELYNKQLIQNQIVANNTVKPFDSKLLAQFVTIRKISAGVKEQRDFKEEIKGSLNILTDYIFSPELQDSFLNK